MSIGRPLQFDENAALEKALDLFWPKGYSNTSLSDLCTTMGLSKSCLYATFKNKRSLFLRAIDMYVNGLVFELKKQKKDSGNAREFIEAVILGVVNEVNPGIEKKLEDQYHIYTERYMESDPKNGVSLRSFY